MKMKSARLIFPATVVALFAFSMCSYVVKPRDVEDVVVTLDTTKRIALIEEFTGHVCPNCADAARILENLDSVYGENLVVISIHDNFFAEPCPPHVTPICGQSTPGAFAEDFRCPTSASYGAAHPDGPAGPPNAMVNRRVSGSSEIINRGAWAGMVDTIIEQNAIASIHIDHTYNPSTRAVTATVRGTWLMTYTGSLNVAVMLTESGMTGWQTDGMTNCIPDFEFRHVLRECINTPGSITGVPLFTGTTGVGTRYTYSLSAPYVLPAAFNADNCHLVAIIYDTVTGEVMQAWEEPL